MIYNIVCINYFFDDSHVIQGFEGKHNFVFCAMFFVAGCLIYLYREFVVAYVKKHRRLVFGVMLVVVLAYFCNTDKSVEADKIWLMLIFASWIVYAIGSTSSVLSNKITRFISGISMEIYLCHMVVFRIVEKMKLLYLLGNGWIAYIIVSLLVIIGSIVFSIGLKWFVSIIGRKINAKFS